MAPSSVLSVQACVDGWLAKATPEGREWLNATCARIAAGDERTLSIAFSSASRRLGKGDLALGRDALAEAARAVPGLDPRRWTIDQAARARLVMAIRAEPAAAWLATLDRIFAACDLGESIALYQAIPLLPHPELLRLRAAEGLRSNMKAVFEAVALDNPYAAAELDEDAWNQLVLKCLFVGSPLDRVVGLDRRANPRLARMLCEYAHERWAATRAVEPRLWRPVGRHADAAGVADLARVLASGTTIERSAAALALHENGGTAARALLAGVPDLASAAASGSLTWDSITMNIAKSLVETAAG